MMMMMMMMTMMTTVIYEAPTLMESKQHMTRPF